MVIFSYGKIEKFSDGKNPVLTRATRALPLALEVQTEAKLNELFELLKNKVKIEFAPELVGSGPRKHMMCYEPGGIRIEFIWPGI